MFTLVPKHVRLHMISHTTEPHMLSTAAGWKWSSILVYSSSKRVKRVAQRTIQSEIETGALNVEVRFSSILVFV